MARWVYESRDGKEFSFRTDQAFWYCGDTVLCDVEALSEDGKSVVLSYIGPNGNGSGGPRSSFLILDRVEEESDLRGLVEKSV